MPAIILTGHPKIGKTSLANLIAERVQQNAADFNISNVFIVNEENTRMMVTSAALGNSNQTKKDCYKDSNAEKMTRSALKSAFERALSSSSSSSSGSQGNNSSSKPLVILDSLNYIKGYRYELHCISKSMRQQHCVLWVLNNDARNNLNQVEGDLSDEEIDALIMRYEAPDERNRWDKPLYRIDLTGSTSNNSDCLTGNNNVSNSSEKRVLEKSVYNMHNLSESIAFSDSMNDESKSDKSNIVPLVQRVDEFLNSFLKGSTALTENISTKKVVAAKTDVLHDIDRVTQQVLIKIMNAQKIQGGYGCTTVEIADKRVKFEREVTMSDMRKFRRQFIKWIGLHPPSDCSEAGISLTFLEYIQTQL